MLKYIVRLDDACPTMNREKWSRFESLLDKYNIKPMVAVVPQNVDKELIIDNFDSKFWEKVKMWHKKNWHIALHGYEHLYENENSGIVPMNNRSEFAGLSLDEQITKIKKAIQIFKQNNVKTRIWIAPSHTFDFNTLEALKRETLIDIISDGVSTKPFKYKGFFWIPQQLWQPTIKEDGIWTICFHPNMMEDLEFEKLEEFILKNEDKFKFHLEDIVDSFKQRDRSLSDRLYHQVFFLRRKMRKIKLLVFIFNLINKKLN